MPGRSQQRAAAVSVIVLTLNEELNLPHALASVRGWADQVFVVDSFSSDDTLEIARTMGAQVYQNPWEHWAAQRNWALAHLPLRNDWVLFLDADEQVTTELAQEIGEVVATIPEDVAGCYIDRRFIFMGRWLRYAGYSPNWVLRFVRRQRVRILPAADREYFAVAGKVRYLVHHMLHEDRKDLTFWINKHNQLSNLAARGQIENATAEPEAAAAGELEGRRRLWIRRQFWNRLPGSARPFASFIYRYLVRLGFLDGPEGFLYYALHEFWYPLLIYGKVAELSWRRARHAPRRPPAGQGHGR